MAHTIITDASIDSSAVLTPEAVLFLTQLHHKFNSKRLELLQARTDLQKQLNQGKRPSLSELDTRPWKISPIPKDLIQRHVEITGPTDAKMLINALNSGADVFMADFEDANVPTWKNLIEGQLNLSKALNRTLIFANQEGKIYKLNDKVAVLMVRPRGWHLPEKHVNVDGETISGSLFDIGLFLFHNARKLISLGSGPYFYLPKIESHHEARLWNEVFTFAEHTLGISHGSIKATVLIETILAAFEMDAILYELREHSAGLNAGRWDYIFSIIKKFQLDQTFIFPDRHQITMTAPFMHAYTSLLVETCHRRGAHAIGGMAAYIPNRKDNEMNEIALEKVREDKKRESHEGFDGTWVAHPDLVPLAKEVFAYHLKGKPHQMDYKSSENFKTTADDLLDFNIHDGKITEKGLRKNISITLTYLESWLRGIGAVAISNLMEDTATAEISRAQVWQWLHRHSASLEDGRPITLQLFKALLEEEYDKIKLRCDPQAFAKSSFHQAKALFKQLAESNDCIDFLTTIAYTKLKG